MVKSGIVRTMDKLWKEVWPRNYVDPSVRRNHALFKRLDQSMSLTSYSFVVVDTELTGMNPRRDEIVSIGAVRVKNMGIDPSDSYYTLIRPRMLLPKFSTLIHSITPEEVQMAPRLEEVLPDFIEYCGDSLIVGHHVGLDMTFLNRACRRHLGSGLRTPCLDTMRLAQVYEEELWETYYDQYNLNLSYNLAHLAERHGLPSFPKHNALMDAMQAAYLFLLLTKKLKKGNVKTLKQLHHAGRTRRFL